MDNDPPKYNELAAVRVSCVLAGILAEDEMLDNDTHPQWCERNKGRFAFSPEQIVSAASGEWSANEWWRPGVYFLVWDGRLVYVGRSGCVGKRLYEHRREGKPFQAVAAIVGLPLAAQQDIEDAYVTAFRPPWNSMATSSYLFSKPLRETLGAMQKDLVMPSYTARLPAGALARAKAWELNVIGKRQADE